MCDDSRKELGESASIYAVYINFFFIALKGTSSSYFPFEMKVSERVDVRIYDLCFNVLFYLNISSGEKKVQDRHIWKSTHDEKLWKVDRRNRRSFLLPVFGERYRTAGLRRLSGLLRRKSSCSLWEKKYSATENNIIVTR